MNYFFFPFISLSVFLFISRGTVRDLSPCLLQGSADLFVWVLEGGMWMLQLCLTGETKPLCLQFTPEYLLQHYLSINANLLGRYRGASYSCGSCFGEGRDIAFSEVNNRTTDFAVLFL